MKRAISLFLILSVMISAAFLPSCSLFTIENTVNNSVSETTPETDPYADALQSDLNDRNLVKVETPDYSAKAEEYLASVSAADFEEVGIIIDSACNIDFSPENAVSETDKAKLKRNRQVEEKFNTTAIFTASTVDDMLSKASESVLSGTSYCDLLVMPMYYLGTFESKGLLMNLNTLPFTDYTADYFYTDIIDQLTAGYDVFGAVGEASSLLEYSYGMYFNKTLIETFGLENPYDLVYSDNWTYDKMLEMCLIASADINRTTETTEETAETANSVYLTGIYGAQNLLCDIVYASTGDQYISTGFGQIPSAAANTEIAEKAVNILKNIFSDEHGFFVPESGVREDSRNQFNDGNILFFADYTNAIDALKDMKADYGLVPMPKMYADQAEYYTFCDIFMPVFATLKTNINIDNTGHFLQAFNAASYGIIDEAYYRDITVNAIRDTDVLNMLDIIRAKYTASFAFAFCSAYPSLSNASFGALRSAAQGGTSFTDAYNYSQYSLSYAMNRAFSLPN